MHKPMNFLALVLLSAALPGCGPSVGVVGMPGMGMPMGMGGFYGGSWGHSTNVAVVNNRSTNVGVYNSEHNNAFVDNHRDDNFYHPGRYR